MYADYIDHPDSKKIMQELVEVHGFEKSYVEDVFKNATKQQKIIDSISKPAEFTWTWERYKKLFIEDKRIRNGKKFIKFSTSEKCETCSGSGSKPGHNPGTCSMCGGHGQVRSSQGFFTVQQTCPQCAGAGEEITNPCNDCNGQG